MLKTQATQEVASNVLPNIINSETKSPLNPLPLEPLPEKKLIDIPIGLTYTDQEATPAIEVSYRMVFNNGLIRKGVLDEKGQAIEKGVPTSGGEIMFAYEETTEQVQSEVNKLYSELEASVKIVAEQMRDAYLINLEKENAKENKLDAKAQQLRENLRAVIQEQVDELTAQSREYDSQSWIERRWDDTKSAGAGLGHGVTDYIPDLGEFGDLMDSMDVDMLDMADIIFNGNQKALKEIEDKLKNSDRLAGGFEEAKESMETLILLLSDEKTREILISLPQKFLEVTPNDQLVEIGVSQATQTGLDAAAVGGTTFVSGVLTGGPGGVAGAAIALTATSARKAGKILEAMMGILKKISAGLKKLKNKNGNKGHPFTQTAKDLKTPLPDATKKGSSSQDNTTKNKDDDEKFKCDWKKCKGSHSTDVNKKYPRKGSVTKGKASSGKGYESEWISVGLEPWVKYGSHGINPKLTKEDYEAEFPDGVKPRTANIINNAIRNPKVYITQKHHIISANIFTNFNMLSHNAKLIGWNVNNKENGICLPYFIGDIVRHDLQCHRGPHPALYNKNLAKMLRNLEKKCTRFCDTNKQKSLSSKLELYSKKVESHIRNWNEGWYIRGSAIEERKQAFENLKKRNKR